MTYDALLLLSFGGPEKSEDIRPFLENVTRGRGIPPERLDEVGEHYYKLGGRSPINDQNREIIRNVEQELVARGLELPVYFGNRNWHPMLEDTVAQMSRDGVRNALVFATSAWGGYSGCRQYHEDVLRGLTHLQESGLPPVQLQKLRGFHDHPLLVTEFAAAVTAARQSLPDELQAEARLVFTAHSVPNSADDASGPAELGGNLYSRQVHETAALVAAAANTAEFDVVWQSRSGSPHIPWLEPDIVDHVQDLASQGTKAVIVCPIGFITDHIEVVWDLDTELVEEVAPLGVTVARAATPGLTASFAKMIVELIDEQTEGAPARRLGQAPQFGAGVNGALCGTDCCVPARRRS
ncbi:ferrochelatase [Corynebacterium ulceribovis]|uniref:ferrochelatase n=1 Tax=Corynebacterium ulceribovis TaxID=487732 RepID=UPI0003826F3D|nr:ferrochelatase [Corynebacterium ulceribovis]